ncbi:hypothetical protein GCM10010964_03040 [Caldovatus sediminis]|uniref:Uncharacterized protein n=1 Tax=Caldovatus sediminis TaxID=2041189 RepID=A0A8J2Z7V2_9PROT|nr:hypothetical protein [Caldovatus sediminis]GGG18202.1 hypothetical protein GCM10010964_03040 [Caldovatus sediminis]
MFPSARFEPRRAGRQRHLAAWASALSAWAISVLLLHWFYATHLQREEQAAEFAALERAAAMAEAVEQGVLRKLDFVEGLHELLQLRERLDRAGDTAGAAAIEEHLTAVARRARFGVQAIGVIRADGVLHWSTAQAPGAQPVSVAEREYFAVHRDGKRELHVSALTIGRTSAIRWSMHLTRALEDRSGNFAGVALVSLDPIELSKKLGALHAGHGEASVVLRLDDGALLALGAPEERRFLGGALPEEAVLFQLMRAERAGRARVWSHLSGRELLFGYRTVSGAPLAVAYGLDAEQELAPIRALRRSAQASMAIAATLSLMILLLVLWWMPPTRARASLPAGLAERAPG